MASSDSEPDFIAATSSGSPLQSGPALVPICDIVPPCADTVIIDDAETVEVPAVTKRKRDSKYGTLLGQGGKRTKDQNKPSCDIARTQKHVKGATKKNQKFVGHVTEFNELASGDGGKGPTVGLAVAAGREQQRHGCQEIKNMAWGKSAEYWTARSY